MQTKKVSPWIALIPVIFLLVTLSYTILILEGSPHIPLMTSAIFASLVAMFMLGAEWSEIEEGIVETIKMSMGAILILMIIGMVIGTWILSGVVPTMIYYGLKILSPKIFLLATLLMCSIVSLSTGSSWTTAGTVGVALMGVGMGLGIPSPMIGGAIISGAYFGDKMSPLSDTTNLAPAMAGAKLFDHIKHMLFTTGPSYIIAGIVFLVLGFQFGNNAMDLTIIDEMNQGLSQGFNLNPLLLLIPLIVIGIVVMKVPAIPGLFGGAIIGGFAAMIFQGSTIGDVVNALHSGYVSTTGVASVDELLTRGGLNSMMGTVALILCAMAFGGVMEKTGMLEALANVVLHFARSTGQLVVAVIGSAVFMNLVAGDQYLAIVIPGRMYKEAFERKGLAPKNLSRALEDSGTLTSSLIPWNTCGAFMIATLGLAPWTYIPFCILNLVNPLVSIFYGFTGITMEKLDENAEVQTEIA
ncbi:Na+/H+ antiporter NhaC [Fusibacter ferrireducens]|uniref:Na+/H+ antiporter NhaC n=1 Tax=Fusibacter ferrireducens TaxID=2785058 RepID=A0ABR9ZQK4_9FIRM|nr:Na+/H+ antiporter NhaC [Fusibacter ferrireducens]MBF4692742.1 Na+/H+ antiporter NhaC [Fusibacter ferrireducens]